MKIGQRVRTTDGMTGEIVSIQSGWHYVQFEDGSEDRFLASWLSPV